LEKYLDVLEKAAFIDVVREISMFFLTAWHEITWLLLM